MVGFLDRHNVALKSGEIVNKANYFSDEMLRWLRYCAAGIMRKSEIQNIEIDELVNECWLKHSRYYPKIQPQGTRQAMYKFLDGFRNSEVSLTDAMCAANYPQDDFEDTFAGVVSKISDTRAKFMLDLFVRHGMSCRQIGKCFDRSGQAVEAKIKRVVRNIL